MPLPETKAKKLAVSTKPVGSGLQKFVVLFALSDVVADIHAAAEKIPADVLKKFGNRPDRMPGFWSKVEPCEGALRQLKELNKYKQIDWHFVSSFSWKNPDLLLEKQNWVDDKFGALVKDRLIFTKRKDLLRGDYLVYRHASQGVFGFQGKRYRFGDEPIPYWSHVVHHFGYIAEHGPFDED